LEPGSYVCDAARNRNAVEPMIGKKTSDRPDSPATPSGSAAHLSQAEQDAFLANRTVGKRLVFTGEAADLLAAAAAFERAAAQVVAVARGRRGAFPDLGLVDELHERIRVANDTLRSVTTRAKTRKRRRDGAT